MSPNQGVPGELLALVSLAGHSLAELRAHLGFPLGSDLTPATKKRGIVLLRGLATKLNDLANELESAE